jgi:hypothetical protein
VAFNTRRFHHARAPDVIVGTVTLIATIHHHFGTSDFCLSARDARDFTKALITIVLAALYVSAITLASVALMPMF